MNDKYFDVNKDSWNRRLSVHVESKFYDNESFIRGKNSLNEPELDLLGNVDGLDLLHLQCHFGQDSISLSRIGAVVTGVDISDTSIAYAQQLAARCSENVEFICSNVIDYRPMRDYDLVFTSYGTIIWLPDLKPWAEVIAKSLKPGGKFVIVDFHPFLYVFDDGLENLQYDYFNTGAIVEKVSGTYTENSTEEVFDSVTWNHSMSEIINALISAGLSVEAFDEYDFSPYNCFPGMKEVAPRKYIFNHQKISFPLTYGIVAKRPESQDSDL